MTADLVLTTPHGELYSVLNIDELSCNQHLYNRTNLTPAELAAYTTCFAETMARYQIRRPVFPLPTLLQLTELGSYWLDLAHDAARLYDAEEYEEFEATYDELITAVQIDMEEDHRLPYSKHRHYDTLLGFKADYEGRVYCQGSGALGISPTYYAYLRACLDTLQKAVAAGCAGLLQC
jgi:hypothetical protein